MLTAVQKSLIFAFYQRILSFRGCKKTSFQRFFVLWKEVKSVYQIHRTNDKPWWSDNPKGVS